MKPQGKCIFCGSTDISGEHIWPQWAAPILGHKSKRGKRVEQFVVHTKKFQLVSTESKKGHGHTADRKVRAVCQKCNNTWMSAIEILAKDVLIPMMQGSNIALTQEMQKALAEWITLKVLVAENNRPGEAIFPQEDRDSFKNSRAIPSSMRIWIGRCVDDSWHSVFVRHAALFGLNPFVVPNAGQKNTQSTTIGIGELLIHSMACITEGIDLNNVIQFDGRRLAPLWPTSSNVLIWPPEQTLSKADATNVAFTLDNFIKSPHVIWGG